MGNRFGGGDQKWPLKTGGCWMLNRDGRKYRLDCI